MKAMKSESKQKKQESLNWRILCRDVSEKLGFGRAVILRDNSTKVKCNEDGSCKDKCTFCKLYYSNEK